MIFGSTSLTKAQTDYLKAAAALPRAVSFGIWDIGRKQTGNALLRRGLIDERRAHTYMRTYRISDRGRLALRLHLAEPASAEPPQE